jgi:hypothetical protein
MMFSQTSQLLVSFASKIIKPTRPSGNIVGMIDWFIEGCL